MFSSKCVRIRTVRRAKALNSVYVNSENVVLN